MRRVNRERQRFRSVSPSRPVDDNQVGPVTKQTLPSTSDSLAREQEIVEILSTVFKTRWEQVDYESNKFRYQASLKLLLNAH